jgi:hypothetical protein
MTIPLPLSVSPGTKLQTPAAPPECAPCGTERQQVPEWPGCAHEDAWRGTTRRSTTRSSTTQCSCSRAGSHQLRASPAAPVTRQVVSVQHNLCSISWEWGDSGRPQHSQNSCKNCGHAAQRARLKTRLKQERQREAKGRAWRKQPGSAVTVTQIAACKRHLCSSRPSRAPTKTRKPVQTSWLFNVS